MHSHALDAFSATPRLVIRSASARAGKTTLLAVLSHLVPRALDLCAGAPAAILWSLGFRPTLLIDDAPALLNASRDLRAFVRNGCRPAAARLLRIAQGYTQNIRLYAAAALTVEGSVPRFLAHRCIEVLLEPPKAGQIIERLNDPATEPLRLLCRKLVRWASDRGSELRRMNSAEQSGGDENWTPLLLIARDSGGEWESRARTAMQQSLAQTEPPILQMLLSDIREILERRKSGEEPLPASPADLKAMRESQDRGERPPPNIRYIADRDSIPSAHLARLLGEIEGQPWHEWSNGQPITKHALAKLLKPAGVRPSGTLRFRTANQNGAGPDLTDKGYKLAQFKEAFAKYLPQQPSQPNSAPDL
jgi:putative DNA primase/helicase